MGLGKSKVNIFSFLKLADRYMGVDCIVYMYALNIFMSVQ